MGRIAGSPAGRVSCPEASGPVGLAAAVAHGSFIVWRPGSRLNQVQLENASSGGNLAYTPTALGLTVGAEILNFAAVSNLEHQQQWHIKRL